jgi:hypothetical protein
MVEGSEVPGSKGNDCRLSRRRTTVRCRRSGRARPVGLLEQASLDSRGCELKALLRISDDGNFVLERRYAVVCRAPGKRLRRRLDLNVALAVPADGNGNIDGRNAGVENHHAPHLVELFAGGAVRSCRGRLYRRHVRTPEKNPPAAIVQAIEAVVAKDAVFISRA